MYIVPDVIDGQVVHMQAISRRDRDGTVTVVHAHAYLLKGNGKKYECNSKCKIYTPGNKSISYLDYLAGAVPEKEET
jgi:hypothetical protein